MSGLEDMLRSSAPAGNIGKPLMLALLALLASGALFGGGGSGKPASAPAPSPQPNAGDGGLLGGLGGLLDKLQKGGLGDVANSWVGSGQNKPVSPGQLGPALGNDLIKTLSQRSGIPEDELIKQLSQILPGVVDKLTPQGRIPTAAELPQLN
jgi:uncharacterized protein YidB (DUF937 family)